MVTHQRHLVLAAAVAELLQAAHDVHDARDRQAHRGAHALGALARVSRMMRRRRCWRRFRGHSGLPATACGVCEALREDLGQEDVTDADRERGPWQLLVAPLRVRFPLVHKVIELAPDFEVHARLAVNVHVLILLVLVYFFHDVRLRLPVAHGGSARRSARTLREALGYAFEVVEDAREAGRDAFHVGETSDAAGAFANVEVATGFHLQTHVTDVTLHFTEHRVVHDLQLWLNFYLRVWTPSCDSRLA